jgi:WD40 repeat protein
MLLATGDDFGKVNLFKYPCVQENSACNSYLGHSSHVTKVKFTARDRLVISTGGNDKTVIVWENDACLNDGGTSIMENEAQSQETHY